MGGLDFLKKLFTGAFSYFDKKGRKWWLHQKQAQSGITLYYFSQSEEGAVAMPQGYAVLESSKSGMPLLKKTTGG